MSWRRKHETRPVIDPGPAAKLVNTLPLRHRSLLTIEWHLEIRICGSWIWTHDLSVTGIPLPERFRLFTVAAVVRLRLRQRALALRRRPLGVGLVSASRFGVTRQQRGVAVPEDVALELGQPQLASRGRQSGSEQVRFVFWPLERTSMGLIIRHRTWRWDICVQIRFFQQIEKLLDMRRIRRKLTNVKIVNVLLIIPRKSRWHTKRSPEDKMSSAIFFQRCCNLPTAI